MKRAVQAVIPAQAGIQSGAAWTSAFAGATEARAVIPAQAGIQSGAAWTPAFAGVTKAGVTKEARRT